MLNIYINNYERPLSDDYVSYVSDYFDDEFEPEWFADDYVRSIIREIDHSQVVGEGYGVNIYNDVLGNIPPYYLSSGCKALILLYLGEGIKINGDRLGDNCMHLLLEIAGKKDITIALGHIPPFPEEFYARIINNGEMISGLKEFVSAYVRISYDC